MPPICTVGGVDVSAYLKAPLNVRPGGDGQVGGATLVFDQQAGGLDLRTMMDVRVWIPHTGSSGIASKGRLFGGLVMTRDTTNMGTTKQWVLKCWDYNKILKSSVRRAAPVYAVTLSADTLDDQLVQLFGILQGSADIQIQVECALTTAMPAVTYPGGMSFEWYLQQLLIKAYELEPTEIPGYYMGTNVTSGIGDTFGNPVLWVYDAALTPSPAFVFSDTPTGGEKSVYPDFRRVTDATALTQLQQAWWSGVVLSASDDTSQAAYPNPYIDQMGDGTGYWADEVIEDTHSATEDEAQAALDRLVAVKGNPRDTFVWVTEERLLPGEYIELKWDLEGIPAGTSMRVAQVSSGWEEPDKVISQLTLNTRRLGLFDDGTGGYFAAPIEGSVAPLPPANAVLSSNTYNPQTHLSELDFTITASPSPNTIGYRLVGTVNNLPFDQDVGADLTPTLYLFPDTVFSLRALAYDRAGHRSETFPAPDDPAITGTSAGVSFIDDPSLSVVRSGADKTGYYILVEVDHASIDTTYGGWVRAHPIPNGPDTLVPIATNSLVDAGSTALPALVRIPALAANTTYELSAQVVTEYGQESEFTDPPVEYRIYPPPDRDPPSWDKPHTDEVDELGESYQGTVSGWEQVDPDPSIAIFVSHDTTHTFGGRASLRHYVDSPGAGPTADDGVISLSPPTIVEGGSVRLYKGYAAYSVGGSTRVNTLDEVLYYDGTGSGEPDETPLSTEIIYDDEPPAEWDAGEDSSAYLYYAKIEVPPTARYERRRLTSVITVGGNYEAYYGPMEAEIVISGRELAPTVNVESTLNFDAGGVLEGDPILVSGSISIQNATPTTVSVFRLAPDASQTEDLVEINALGPRNITIDKDGHLHTEANVRIDGNLDTAVRIQLTEIAAPSTPASGKAVLYVKSDGKIYLKDDAGTEYDLTAAVGGITGTGTSGRVALWSGTSTQNSDSGLTFNTTTDTLTVAGGGNFGGDMAVDASGGSSGSPRILGLTNLGYARIQVGDAFTSMQSNNGGRFVFQAYHGMSFWGARGTTGSVQGFEAGGGGGDPSVRIYGSQSGTKVAAVQGASGQTANLLDFENSSGTVLSGIASDGAFKFGTNQVVGSRKTGWAAWTGTATRTSKATSTATLVNVAEALKALIDDLISHGLIGT